MLRLVSSLRLLATQSVSLRMFGLDVMIDSYSAMASRYDVSFVGMILPGDGLDVKLRHVTMRGGTIVINIETLNSNGEKGLQGSAEVARPTTVYVFTGQGSQDHLLHVLFGMAPMLIFLPSMVSLSSKL